MDMVDVAGVVSGAEVSGAGIPQSHLFARGKASGLGMSETVHHAQKTQQSETEVDLLKACIPYADGRSPSGNELPYVWVGMVCLEDLEMGAREVVP